MKLMPGKFIFVSGLSGAGKSTMVRAALDALDDCRTVVMCTTRPRRHEELDSHEYWFATEDEYELLKSKSNNWDETIYAGYKYGTDGEKYMNYLRDGLNIVVAVAPDYDIIRTISAKYHVDPVTIWLDTDVSIARGRTKGDDDRATRQETVAIRDKFDYIVQPTGNLERDSAAFVQLVSEIIEK
jgi:guanylate kinase